MAGNIFDSRSNHHWSLVRWHCRRPYVWLRGFRSRREPGVSYLDWLAVWQEWNVPAERGCDLNPRIGST